jgi:hypothetical protein
VTDINSSDIFHIPESPSCGLNFQIGDLTLGVPPTRDNRKSAGTNQADARSTRHCISEKSRNPAHAWKRFQLYCAAAHSN